MRKIRINELDQAAMENFRCFGNASGRVVYTMILGHHHSHLRIECLYAFHCDFSIGGATVKNISAGL
jgi:hypothetical protein